MKIKLLILSVLLILHGSSCTKNNTNSKEITFWHFWSEPSQRAVLDSLVDVFEKEYGCTIKTTELSWSDGKTKLLAAFNSNTAPDVIELGSDWIAQFSSSGVLYPFSSKEISLNNYIDISHDAAQYQQKLYAVPWTVDTRVLYVNTSLLQEIGVTVESIKSWDDVLEASKKIQALPHADVYGFGANGSDPHRLYKRLLPFFWSYNGTIFKDNQVQLMSQENIQALSMYVALSKEGIVETQRHLDGLFVKGKLGFWFSGSWLLNKLASAEKKFTFDVRTLPNGTGKGISFAGGEFLALNASSKNKELATKFIKFLSDSEHSLHFCKALPEAGFPASKQYFSDKSLLKLPYKSTFAQQLLSSRMTPVEPMWLDIETIIENSAVEAMLEVKTVNQALYDAQVTIQEIMSYK